MQITGSLGNLLSKHQLAGLTQISNYGVNITLIDIYVTITRVLIIPDDQLENVTFKAYYK